MRNLVLIGAIVFSCAALSDEGLENPGQFNLKFFGLLSKSILQAKTPFKGAQVYEAYDVFCLMTPHQDKDPSVSCKLYDRPKKLKGAKLAVLNGAPASALLELLWQLPVNQGVSGAESEIIRCGRYDYGNGAPEIDCRISVKLAEDK